ncbi:MAG: LytTR family transcriptional regulator [Chitinophagaceae bacterium]|nr:LytTR family transcriptional regulator [Chitinophagaceae bacterium]
MKKIPLHKDDIQLIRQTIFSATQYIFIPVERSFLRLFLCDIIWIEAAGSYVKFHTFHGIYLSLFNLKGAMNRLPADKFSRINQSVIINIIWIDWFDKDQMILANGLPFGFGKDGKKDLIQKIYIL